MLRRNGPVVKSVESVRDGGNCPGANVQGG